jgi:hypothetical protein
MAKIMKLFTLQFSPFSCYFSFRLKYFLSALISNTHKIQFKFDMRSSTISKRKTLRCDFASTSLKDNNLWAVNGLTFVTALLILC